MYSLPLQTATTQEMQKIEEKKSGQTAHVTRISTDSQCSAAKLQQDFVGFLVYLFPLNLCTYTHISTSVWNEVAHAVIHAYY